MAVVEVMTQKLNLLREVKCRGGGYCIINFFLLMTVKVILM